MIPAVSIRFILVELAATIPKVKVTENDRIANRP